MLARFRKFLGFDPPTPVIPTAPARPAPGGTAGAGDRVVWGPGQTVGMASNTAPHATWEAEKKGGEVKPAMAVIPRDAVQRMPRVASPGLLPVDPEEGTIPPSTTGFAACWPHAAFAGVDERPRETESGLTGEPYLPFDPPLDLDSIEIFKHVEGRIISKVVAPADDLDLSAFLDAVADFKGSSIAAGKDCRASIPACQGMVFSEGLATTCEHFMLTHADIYPKDCSVSGAESVSTVESAEGRPSAPAVQDIDLPTESGLPRVTTPARPFLKRPQRVADRPRSEEWNDDELLTLPEAAALFWPDGPITTNTLRTAGREGGLAITVVARKFFTTPMAIRRMGLDHDGRLPSAGTAVNEVPASPQSVLDIKIAEARSSGRRNSRRGGARSKSATSAASGRPGR